MTPTIARARREDAFACAALRLQMDLEAGERNRPGFLTEHADHWLAYYDDMPTWLASSSDGTALGLVQTSLVHRASTLARPAQPLLYVDCVFVTPSARGEGLATRLLRTVDAWADANDVVGMMLDARPEARSLCERVGFTVLAGRLMHREAPFTTDLREERAS